MNLLNKQSKELIFIKKNSTTDLVFHGNELNEAKKKIREKE
jgi:hypothetical protein